MKLYDKIITELNSYLDNFKGEVLNNYVKWQESSEKEFIFEDEAAVELGAKNKKSTYLTLYTTNKDLVKEDKIILIGDDIKNLPKESSYARITILLLDEACLNKTQADYNLLRTIEYKRYKVNPTGFMLRVNTNQLKESGRISKDAVKKNISFAHLGTNFIEKYKTEKAVLNVIQVIITSDSVDFEYLNQLSVKSEGITKAFDQVMKNIKMDCNTCGLKTICDEVEELREVHFKNLDSK